MIGVIRRAAIAPPSIAIGTLIAAVMVAVLQMAPLLQTMRPQTASYDLPTMLLYHSLLPRMATALLAGACLGLSGALFQQVLRNPLASPTTLGISAGANLALVAVTLFVPDLLGYGRDLVALAGSVAVALIVFALGARRGFSPFSLVLSGLVISLWCGALSAVLMLLNERYLVSLFIWGSGSLSQQSWDIPVSLSYKLGIVAVLAGLLVRPLGLLELGEGNATALGVPVKSLRIAAVAIAVALAAFVTSAVGVIGFIGLVAPIIIRLAGARRPAEILLWSAITGGGLLWLADGAVQLVAGAMSDFLPTGAVTAVLGSPLLLFLLPRLKVRHRAAAQDAIGVHGSGRVSRFAVVALAVTTLVLAVLVSLFIGRIGVGDWAFIDLNYFFELLALRLPRVLAAMSAGAMLAIAGTILQRLTGNEMASPEVLGISAGATLGLTAGLFVIGIPGLGGQLALAGLGAMIVLAVILLNGSRGSFAPERVLLAGIALSAMADAVVGVLSATGDPRSMFLLRWMSGSTYNVDLMTAVSVTGFLVVFGAVALRLHRWLELLPLGPTAAGALGVPLRTSRFVLFVLAGVLSAAATLAVGPLSFVGLMAPHIARELGLRKAVEQLLVSAVLGGLLMVAADWIGRNIVFPYQLPAGIVSALVGAPFLILLLRRRRESI
ncbi:Fe(3+)-hydroxamate ABC transporter permease FhuB [Ciceribacter sp. L1K23]|uniref:Fe(3+)-hydroxamate ABC transporter permease FhuB n=1 Tax=Ciceribacter sp. L1K23 TaxID=2820276 RepID=UPI001B836483|nr:Fe(3+)-hydroxamate ABC transporter permease FhuB [Ciceribacter sp. L1K23]MBR0554063.1 Fe(3+)-hydroxamate ABC transporter permease FhuB [Ciceribacter sp. L1K23]